MNLSTLKERATLVFVGSIPATGMLHSFFFFGELAPAIVLLTGIVGGLALLVLLLATVADATVETLKKKEK